MSESLTTYTNLFALHRTKIGIELWLITGAEIGLALMVLRKGNGKLKVSRQMEVRL